MSSAILTRWPITQEVVVTADDVDFEGLPTDDALQRWFAQVWRAYLERCPKLTGVMRRGRVRLDMRPLRAGPQ